MHNTITSKLYFICCRTWIAHVLHANEGEQRKGKDYLEWRIMVAVSSDCSQWCWMATGGGSVGGCYPENCLAGCQSFFFFSVYFSFVLLLSVSVFLFSFFLFLFLLSLPSLLCFSQILVLCSSLFSTTKNTWPSFVFSLVSFLFSPLFWFISSLQKNPSVFQLSRYTSLLLSMVPPSGIYKQRRRGPPYPCHGAR